MIRIFFIACKFTFFPRGGQMLPLFFVVIIANGVFLHHRSRPEENLRRIVRTDITEDVHETCAPSEFPMQKQQQSPSQKKIFNYTEESTNRYS